jgi:hypothetical protein
MQYSSFSSEEDLFFCPRLLSAIQLYEFFSHPPFFIAFKNNSVRNFKMIPFRVISVSFLPSARTDSITIIVCFSCTLGLISTDIDSVASM